MRATSAATATAGAVFRPTGSRMIAAGFVPTCSICSATMKRWLSLHTTIGAATSATPSTRLAVSCSMVWSPTSGSSCFGYSSRDSGHRRVPEPPERMTGISMGDPTKGKVINDQRFAVSGSSNTSTFRANLRTGSRSGLL